MNAVVELLIHISAPSRGSDDARYRKQALGVLGFEAATRHTVLSRDSKPQEHEISCGGTLGTAYTSATEQLSEPLRGEDNARAGENTHLGLGQVVALQAPHRTEVQDVPASPIPLVEPSWTSPTVFATSPPSTHSRPPHPSSAAPPSSLEPRIHIPQTPFPSRPATAPNASSSEHSPSLLRRTQSDSWETPPSIVPDSQPSLRSQNNSVPFFERSSPSSHSRSPHHSPPSSPSAKRRRLTASPTNATPSTATASQPPPSPLVPSHRTSRSTSNPRPSTNATSSTASASASSPLPPPPQLHLSSPPSQQQSPPPQLPPSLPPASPVHNTITNVTTHVPPAPPTALVPFTSHITPSLSILARELPLLKFFRPVHTARGLRVLERGYWVVEIEKVAREKDDERAVAGGKDDSGGGGGGGGGEMEMRGWRGSTGVNGTKGGPKGEGRKGGKEGKEEEEGKGRKEEGKEDKRWKEGRGDQRRDGGKAAKADWQPRFWEYLTRFIGEGRAGWGVWCERSVPPPLSTSASASASASPSPPSISGSKGKENGEGGEDGKRKGRGEEEEEEKKGEGEVIKIYCWGEVVGHVWLLLFLASERNVRGRGARWVDGGGEVVVCMA